MKLFRCWTKVLAVGLLGMAAQAQAVNYVFPGTLPAACSGSGPTYTCSALTLGYNDTITINTPRPATITINGNFSTDNAKINAAGSTGNLTIVVNGTLTTGYQAEVNANVAAGVVNDSGGEVKFGGDVTANTGNILLGFKTTVAGTVTSGSGSITMGNEAQIGGSVTSASGAVLVKYRSAVTGSVSTNGTVTLENETTVGGSVVGGAGAINVQFKAAVTGSVVSTSGTILMDNQTVAGACVKSSGSAAITLNYQANVNSVCCGATCGNSCVTNSSSFAMPPACTSQIIAEYRMDEASWNGTVGEVKDSSGNGAHGTAKISNGSTPVASTAGGSPAYINASQSTCRYGEFDTTSGTVRTYTYVELPSMPVLTNGFSVTAWIRSTDVSASGQRIFVRDDNQNGWAISLGDGGSGRLRFFNRSTANSGAVTGGTNPSAGAFAIDTPAVINANTWYFVAATVDTVSKTITVYVYSNTGTQLAKASSLYSGTWSDGTGMAAIGGETAASGEGQTAAFHFRGNVDEVAFFTGAQTQSQIETRLTQVRTCTASQTCIVDDFASGTLNSSLWNPVTIGGGYLPQVVDVSGEKRLRLTTSRGGQANLVQLKKWFPGAGNKIVVQFDHYVYGGSGADGVGVVFSDASVAPAPGGNGGSLGYAQKVATNGFSGGWLGVGIGEHGNFPRPTEGRVGYPSGWVPPAGAAVAAGFYPDSVGVRGSGSGTTGYWLLANSGVLSPEIWTSSNTAATVQKYRITVDNTNNVNAYVTVQRDTTGTGGSYTTVIPTFDARGTNSLQAPVPANWLVSFTGGTGSSTNIHELANISICATYVNDPGSSSDASAFDCLETGTNATWSPTARKPLYTKRAGVNFSMDIAALKADGTLESNYVAAGGNTKYVRVELFNDAAVPAPACSAYSGPVASQTVAFASGNFSGSAGRALSGNFNLAATYSKLRCRVRECTDSSCGSFTAVAPACSSDQFSVRPSAATLVTTANAVAPSITATPAIRAGTNFTLRATTTPTTYAGSLALDIGKLSAQTTTQASTQASGGVVGTLSAGALVANAAAVNSTYSEVGYLYLAAGAYRDDALTAVDAAQGDCVTDTTNGNNLSDTLSGGKYGCAVGNAAAVSLGRFYPDHFTISSPAVAPFCSATATTFTYFGQDGFGTNFTMTAQNAANGTTQNYRGVFAKFVTTGYGNYGFTGSTLPAGSALQTSATAPTGTWTDGVAAIVARHQVSRPTNPAADTLLTVNAAPSDGEVPASAATAVGTNVRLRYGRLRMQNAYGSELLALPVPLEAQYWNGNFYVVNADDSCTTLPMSSIVMTNFTGSLQACETQITPTATQTLANGRIPGGLVLTRPGTNNSGSVDLAINVTATSAGNTCVGPASSAATAANRPWFGPNVGSRATFGIYRSPLIYLRENY
ncbi:DUF6701 domain-containing protein [Rhodoferax sp.]|uniref:DUF6701 domain-containing protein n=1 Tax=Rhodoferax sp. TaxID=50421 RepID=UPI002ACE6ADB|nr:DUF6701 domain-containing protein [Rhodoferax sp.]MDZ7922392.1 DUF6701 domain-containing protein [Rhodoferax sp.]